MNLVSMCTTCMPSPISVPDDADEPDLFRVLQVRDVDDVDATIRPVALRGPAHSAPSGLMA